MRINRYKRELSTGLAYVVLLIVVAVVAPSFFTGSNVRDLALNNAPVLLVSIAMTLVILIGQIDISVGSQFAVATVAAGLLAKSGIPIALLLPGVILIGVLMGTINGVLVGSVRLPSIIVTLAMLVAWRDALRWSTEGAWVENLPPQFQWLGLTQASYPLVTFAGVAALTALLAWTLRHVSAGRAIYATGSNPDAARLGGLDVALVKAAVFALAGMLTGLAAILNSVRFNQIPSNAGIGLEMKVIAAVVVGGAAITGGRGSVLGTVLGVVLLGAIGPALTFLGVSAYWERAIQGAIILTAVGVDSYRASRAHRTERQPTMAMGA